MVESTQRAAQASLEWFENIGQYKDQDPTQFCFNLLTRSRRITYDNLKLRDPEFAGHVDANFAASQGLAQVAPAMFQPFRIGALELKNRIVVSPMDMYSAVDGVPGNFHLVHLGCKALGGAGLVMTEMVCVSAEGRITPGCSGLYTDDQRDSWTEIVDFVHTQSTAKIGAQLGHSGRKGSTKLMWEGIDEPLADGNWDVTGPSALPYGHRNQVPREIDPGRHGRRPAKTSSPPPAAPTRPASTSSRCTPPTATCSPRSSRRWPTSAPTNTAAAWRTGCGIPLEVFDAVRAAWPAHKPLTVRISATDWCDGGNTVDDAVEIARAFVNHGAAGIDVSTGQVAKEEKPAYGRSYQTPFADRIRQEVAAPAGVAVIAVGAISSYDDVNSILLAGRADLCAVGRTHLYDPHWTLHAAAEQDFVGDSARVGVAVPGRPPETAERPDRRRSPAPVPAQGTGDRRRARALALDTVRCPGSPHPGPLAIPPGGVSAATALGRAAAAASPLHSPLHGQGRGSSVKRISIRRRRGAVMARFVQIIEFQTSRIEEIEELGRPSRTEGTTAPTFRRIMATGDRDRPGTYLTIVEFDSYESAMENSNRPETSEFAAKMAALCDGPPVFRNLDVMWEDTGEADQ